MCLCVCLCVSCSSVHMEESSVMQGAQGVLVQNWPTVSSAAGKECPAEPDLARTSQPQQSRTHSAPAKLRFI